MKYSNIFVIITAIGTLVSCSKGDKEQHGFRVEGKVKNATDKVLYLQEIMPEGLKNIDSSIVSGDGDFAFKGQINEKTFCIISFPKTSTVLVIDTNSKMQLSIDANSPEQIGVSGSPETESLQKLLALNNKFMKKVQDLEMRFNNDAKSGQNVDALKQNIRTEYDSVMAMRKREIQNYTLSLERSIVPYFATNYLFPETDFDYIDRIDQKYYSIESGSKYAHALHVKIEDLRRTSVGQTAPDIVLSDPFGKPVALSSLRGKVVLVDFWASWCKPCRAENPNLVKAFTKYRNYGFDIFSVSLDDNREAWQKAINDDKLLWTHVSDLMKWNSAIVGVYKIESIPSSVLLDKEGKIIAKNLRGDVLDHKLAEIFGR